MFTRRRRVWLGEPDGIVYLRTTDIMGDEVIRAFWVPPNGGHVYEVDPLNNGTLGKQVCERLEQRGVTLSCDRRQLYDLIRREFRRAEAKARRDAAT